MDTIKIGKFIATCRKEKGITQANLADKIGVTDKAVSKWECGRSMPDASIFRTLCDELDISVSELMAGEKMTDDNTQRIMEDNLIELVRIYDKIKHYKHVLIGIGLILLTYILRLDEGASSSSNFGSFISGVMLGLSVGIKIIGIIWIVYGLALASKKDH